MKILVTGFEPFGGESRNPSAEAVEALPDGVGAIELVKLILPVERFAAADAVMAAVEEHRPDAILSVGQAGGRAAVSVERVAVNLDDYRIEDNGGNRPVDEPVVPGGPDAYFTNVNVPGMAKAIRDAGVPAEQSLSAGSFVCNHLMYSVRHRLEEQGLSTKFCFIHIPYLPEQVLTKPGQPSMSMELIRKALDVAVVKMALYVNDEKKPC